VINVWNKTEFSRIHKKMKQAFDEETINGFGYTTGFLKRKRKVTPFSLASTLICLLATQKVESLADLQRGFVALTGEDIEYKPFHNQLAKESFPELMHFLLCHLLDRLVLRVLEPIPSSPLQRFTDILLQDGSSLAVNDKLHEEYPGRFTTISPAAVELHATMSLYEDQAIQISLAPDINGERDFLPEANSLDQKLILTDRGYQDLDYCNEVEEAGGAFVSRCKRNLNPTIVVAYVDGKRRRGLEGKKLKNVRAKLKGKNADLIVQWPRYGDEFEPRLLFIWNPVLKRHMFLLTNLEAKEFSLHLVRKLYSLRWQVELLFKEWKSYANVHRFQTGKAGIVEGLLWASLAASLVKRFLSHATSIVFGGIETSTRRTAMILTDHLRDLFRRIVQGKQFRSVFRELFNFLEKYARRAHPKRDKKIGRLSSGLQHVSGEVAHG